MNRYPRMHPQEFADLQEQAGYPFLSEEHAQEFRLRMVQAQAVANALAGPRIDSRRVDREEEK